MINNFFSVIVHVTRNCSSNYVTRRASVITSVAGYRYFFLCSARVTGSFVCSFLFTSAFDCSVYGYEGPTSKFTIQRWERCHFLLFNDSR